MFSLLGLYICIYTYIHIHIHFLYLQPFIWHTMLPAWIYATQEEKQAAKALERAESVARQKSQASASPLNGAASMSAGRMASRVGSSVARSKSFVSRLFHRLSGDGGGSGDDEGAEQSGSSRRASVGLVMRPDGECELYMDEMGFVRPGLGKQVRLVLHGWVHGDTVECEVVCCVSGHASGA